jgi:GNAT superfamily N-acetyltransferase
LSSFEAEQIAILLNKYNKLESFHTASSLLASKVTAYIPVAIGRFILASVAIKRYSIFISEVKHLVVHPLVRGRGVGRALVKLAIKNAETPLLCATIRDNNTNSLRIFEAEGFRKVALLKRDNHKTFFLLRDLV